MKEYCLSCGSEELEFWSEARDIEYFSTEERFTYQRCLFCDALSISPVPEHKLAQIYPPNYNSFVSREPSLVERIKEALDRRLFRRLLRPMTKESLTALDVGGGTGWLLTQARRVEPRLSYTLIVDIDTGAEAHALAAGHDYFCGRIEDFKSEQSFDLILMLNLIEHVRNPVAVLSAVRNLLAPEGRLLIKTPNYDSIDARLFRHRNWGGYHCPRHWVLFTPESFSRAAEQAGLRLLDLQLTQGAPFWSWSVLHWLADKGLARVDRNRPMPDHPLLPLLLAGFAAFDFARRPFSKTSQMFAILDRLQN